MASFNPLDALDPASEESIDDAARIADALIVSEKSSDPFFDESARAFAKFVMLHVRTSPDYAPHERNLITCRALIMAGDAKAAKLAALNNSKNPPSGFALLFDAMKRNTAFNGVIARGGAMLAHMEESSPRLFGSVAQVARTNTDFLDSPAMARVLQSSNFRLSELKTNPKSVMRAYEKRIAGLERQALVLREKSQNASQPKQPFDELFELAIRFLANPWNLWRSGKMEHRNMVLRLTFAERLYYCAKDGFRTPKTTFPFSILSDLRAAFEQMADGVRFELTVGLHPRRFSRPLP